MIHVILSRGAAGKPCYLWNVRYTYAPAEDPMMLNTSKVKRLAKAFFWRRNAFLYANARYLLVFSLCVATATSANAITKKKVYWTTPDLVENTVSESRID